MRTLLGLLMALLVFFLNVVEALIKRGPRSSPPTPPRHLSPEDQVLHLEAVRRQRGYQPGWLYYRCREVGLEDALLKLQQDGRLDQL